MNQDYAVFVNVSDKKCVFGDSSLLAPSKGGCVRAQLLGGKMSKQLLGYPPSVGMMWIWATA